MERRGDRASTQGITRRRLIAALGASVAMGTLAVAGLRRRKAIRRDPPTPTTPTDRARMLETVAAFAGACFGHQLTPAEIADVVASQRTLAAIDPPLAARFPLVAEFADRAAIRRGAASFLAAPLDIRSGVVDDIMATSVESRRSRLLAQVSRHERNRRIVRWEVMSRLPRSYAGSPPAWRRRGYTRWPGVGGDPREYTRAGTPPAC